MNDSGEDLNQLIKERDSLRRDFEQEFLRLTSVYVSLGIGPRRYRYFQMNVRLLGEFITLLNLACFVFGLVLVFQGGAVSSAGVALLVGALFSEGAFAGQVWSHTAYNGYMLLERLSDDQAFAHMKQLSQEIRELSERIDTLERGVRDPDSKVQGE